MAQNLGATQKTFTPPENTTCSKYYQDSTTIFMPMYNNTPKKNQKNSKFLVYFCVILVALCFSLVVFASVLKPKHLTLTINKVVIKSLQYNNSQPSFNITTHMFIKLKNRNFGYFEFDHMNKSMTGIMSLNYGKEYGTMVGSSELKFGTSRVASRGEEEVGVDMMISSSKSRLTVDENNRVESDLNSGFLEFKGYAKYKGKVHLLKKLKIHTVALMNCDIVVDLRKKVVQLLVC